ncbi:MFS transporter [Caldalkalibacillus mannanilyticus]|uniref:MFS transporter n=1 Tax=Caldalkalibacillus mannanilyticus TaxID=1418 RepID=UPI00046A68A4|nr:MFS transporter [Caldalkalibacillus mannanilyticus]
MWKNKNVWIILSGELIAGLGLWTGIIGNLEFLQQHVPSDFFKSVILFIGLTAGLLVGPFAGRIIDSTSKKKVLILAGCGRIVSIFFMFLALEFNSILWMIVFMISIQLSAAFYFPALQSLIPLIVKDQDLLQMNGVHMNVSTIARILGTALAGAMLTIMSLYSLYMASLIAYSLLLLSTFLLQVKDGKDGTDEAQEPAEKQKKDSTQKKAPFKEIIPVLKNVPIAVAALLLSIIPMLFIGGFNLMVISISEIQEHASIKSYLYAIEGICFILGAFLVKKVSEGRNLVQLLLLFSFLTALAHISLFFVASNWFVLLSFGLFGLAAGCFFPISSTIFQTKIPKEYHGRFFSFRGMLDRLLFQVILLATGLFLDLLGLKYTVLLLGSISFVLVIYYSIYYFRTPFDLEATETQAQGQSL